MPTTRDIEYRADGTTMIGRLAVPDGAGKRPAVLIAHEANGLDDHQRGRAAQLAELGYVALAIDYHGGARVYTDREEMMARIGLLAADPDRIRALGRAGLDALLAEPRADASNVAAIGYCFGGTVVLELARSGAAIKALVGFHPGLATSRPEDSVNIKAAVLVCIGSEDPFIPPEQRVSFEAEMRAAGVDWQMNLYGGAKHSFTHPNAAQSGLPGLEYHQPAAERSWQAMLDLFAEVLK
jgi:dienelactone hydrolase